MNVKKSLNLSIKTAKCIIFLVLAICILTGGNGQAATYIKYECVRENSREDCSSSGKIEYIYIYDQIEDQTATTIEEVNRSIPVNKKIIREHGPILRPPGNDQKIQKLHC